MSIFNSSLTTCVSPEIWKVGRIAPIFKNWNQVYRKENFGKKSICLSKIAFENYVDLKKSFDTVDHKIILDRLEVYGFRCEIAWFTSYLNEARQFCRLNEHISKTRK